MAYPSESLALSRYCSQCGAREDSSADFCPSCGNKLSPIADRVCVRCSNKIPLTSPIKFNDDTNRCGKCEREVKDGLHRFRKVFLSCCADGVLDKEKWGILKKRVTQEHLDRKEALAYVRGDAINFLERTLAFAAVDGIITEEEEKFILDLRRILDIPRSLAKPILERLAYQKQLSDIRKGNLIRVKPDKDLGIPAGEKCYLDTAATYQKIGSKSVAFIPGRLVATNAKLRFYASDRVFEIEWTQINGVERRTLGVYIELSQRTGNGQYDVKDPATVEAILDTMVRLAKRKQLVAEDTNNGRVASDIKHEVWQRDKGKCVRCGSTSHLHFVETAPAAKGTPIISKNLQLICDKCGLS